MSLRTLPILFFNLGGELLYILDQRLRAQNVPFSKSQRVAQDIVNHMFKPACLTELFRPQTVLSMKSLKVVFDRLAHTSIMKLNTTAMNKLFDLMVMAVKHQFLMCRRSEDVILVTLNHIDTIRKLVGDSHYHISLLDTAAKRLVDCFSVFRISDFFLLRCTLLSVFQDTHKKVSIYLKNGCQNSSNGRFHIAAGGPVPNGVDIPGTIKYYDEKGDVKSKTSFNVPLKYEQPKPPGSWALRGDRVITLGLNIYSTYVSGDSESKEDKEETDPSQEQDTPTTPEFTFLETLLKIPTSSSSDTFKLVLFSDDNDEEGQGKEELARKSSKETVHKGGPEILRLDPSKSGNDLLSKIAQDFSTQFPLASTPEDDLLDLLDATL